MDRGAFLFRPNGLRMHRRRGRKLPYLPPDIPSDLRLIKHNIQRTPPASRQIITLENLSVPLSTFLKDTSVCIFSVGPSPCPFALQLDRANNSLPHIEGIDVGGPMNEANFQRAMRCHFSCRTEPFLVIHSIHSSISLLICSPVEG